MSDYLPQHKEVVQNASTRFQRLRNYLQAAGVKPGNSKNITRTNSQTERDPKPLGAIIDNLIQVEEFGVPLTISNLSARWPEIVGAEVAAHVTIESFNEDTKTLNLRTDSTAWATQLRLLAAQIVQKITDEFGEEIVENLSVNGPKAPSWIYGIRRVPGRGPRDTYG